MNHIHIKVIVLGFLCLITISHAQDSTQTNDTLISVPSWLNSSIDEYTTFLKDKYNYFITKNGNRVWVATMNLAWNELKRNFLSGENATLRNTTELQQHMVDNLNAQVFKSNQLSQEAYYVYSGYGQSTIDKINFDIKQKFSIRTMPDLKEKLNVNDFISFAYLFKNFKFPIPFERSPQFSFKGINMSGFNAMSLKQKKQIYYKYYNNSNDFMIGIDTQGGKDEIILWKTNLTGVNSFGIDKLLRLFYMLYRLPNNRLARVDQFKMPVVNLDMTRLYKDLLDLKFKNEGKELYQLKKMMEKIQFRITRFGVELQADAEVQLLSTSSRFAKYFYLTSDFWVFLKQKNKDPYLVSLVSYPNQVWTE